jgi:hypothetical protein
MHLQSRQQSLDQVQERSRLVAMQGVRLQGRRRAESQGAPRTRRELGKRGPIRQERRPADRQVMGGDVAGDPARQRRPHGPALPRARARPHSARHRPHAPRRRPRQPHHGDRRTGPRREARAPDRATHLLRRARHVQESGPARAHRGQSLLDRQRRPAREGRQESRVARPRDSHQGRVGSPDLRQAHPGVAADVLGAPVPDGDALRGGRSPAVAPLRSRRQAARQAGRQHQLQQLFQDREGAEDEAAARRPGPPRPGGPPRGMEARRVGARDGAQTDGRRPDRPLPRAGQTLRSASRRSEHAPALSSRSGNARDAMATPARHAAHVHLALPQRRREEGDPQVGDAQPAPTGSDGRLHDLALRAALRRGRQAQGAAPSRA